jgi:peptidoglycan/LPS O-acetylase OafA/YrhL
VRYVTGFRTLFYTGLQELGRRPANQIPALDALRSAAVLLVIGHHWAIKEYWMAGGIETPIQNHPLFYYGWAGVDLFFVLSGFLIGQQLWKELDRTGNVRLGRFLLRRGLRIWPLYFAMLLFYAAGSDRIIPRWSDWLFFSNYSPGGMGRGWSLSTEEQFYVAVPLLLLIFRKRIALGSYLWVIAAIEAAVLFGRGHLLAELAARGATAADAPFATVYPIHTHLEGLLAGLVIALLTVIRPAWFQRRNAHGVSGIGWGVMLGASAVGIGLRFIHHRLFAFLTLGLIFGGVTFWALTDRSILSRPLNAKVFYPISRLSYGMYLNHWWALPLTNRLVVFAVMSLTSSPTLIFLLSLVLGTMVSIAFATLTYVLIERPFLLLRDGRLATRRPAPVHRPTPAHV